MTQETARHQFLMRALATAAVLPVLKLPPGYTDAPGRVNVGEAVPVNLLLPPSSPTTAMGLGWSSPTPAMGLGWELVVDDEMIDVVDGGYQRFVSGLSTVTVVLYAEDVTYEVQGSLVRIINTR